MDAVSSIDAFLADCLRALRHGDDARWTLGFGIEPERVWGRIEFHGIPTFLYRHKSGLDG